MRLTCRYRFAASHRLDSPALSAEENRKLYGKCNNPFGHGHSYALDVTVEGLVDANGQVVNREALDRLVKQYVLSVVDHKNLNQDVPAFDEVPTTENLAALIERMLREHWDLTARLARIRISETERNTFELEAIPE
jgi:6-pyruvoyltetrahydropterin/6-carboxytetrahydropterin synthase